MLVCLALLLHLVARFLDARSFLLTVPVLRNLFVFHVALGQHGLKFFVFGLCFCPGVLLLYVVISMQCFASFCLLTFRCVHFFIS